MSSVLERSSAAAPKRDRFGNAIDPVVGYARGSILRSSVEEAQKLAHARHVIRERVGRAGPQSIGIFTGNQREFPLRPEDLLMLSEEWIGPALYEPELNDAVRLHLGAAPDAGVAVFNRGSAGIVAAMIALGAGGAIVSFVPTGVRSHASAVRGAALAGARFAEVNTLDALSDALGADDVRLLLITTVTSSLASLAEADIRTAVGLARRAGMPVMLDDAYGARLRPALHGGSRSLALGVDLAISNCDKAGLEGPRAGFMAGRADLVAKVQAKAAEQGQEARAPVALAVLRALQRYSEDLLREEVLVGAEVAALLTARLGAGRVRTTDIGPLVHEDDILALVLERAGATGAPAIVPCEASAALGMLMLAEDGLLTVNTSGQPGAQVSLRLKPTAEAVRRVGGTEAVVTSVDRRLSDVSAIVADPGAIRALVLGDRP
jgi:L-seryl-tRNA(Ser) seleniumtransferase